jgi:hypothetical protein
MHMRLGRIFIVVALSATLFGCSGLTIRSDFDPTADFSNYRTWDWMPGTAEAESSDPVRDNAILRGRIQTAIANILIDRGYKLNMDNPDFLVAYHVAFEEKIDLEVVNNYYGYPYAGSYAATWGPAIYGQEVQQRSWDQGTLLLDILDGKTRQLVWRGSAQAEVYPEQDPNKRQKNINNVASKVLEEFPPR